VTGIAVNLASRITDHAGPNEIVVSATVRDLVAGSGLQFESRGARDLKGIDTPVELLAVRRE
jgi:class 3 adenylate cyclase